MRISMLRWALAALVVLSAGWIVGDGGKAMAFELRRAAVSYGADMYPAPRSYVPPLVGHTYIPYEPLAPANFLYHHEKQYVTHHAEGGVTRTHVNWNSRNGASTFRTLLIGPH